MHCEQFMYKKLISIQLILFVKSLNKMQTTLFYFVEKKNKHYIHIRIILIGYLIYGEFYPKSCNVL